MRRAAARAATVLAGGLLLVGLSSGPAVADDGLLLDVPGDGAGFVHDPSVPLLTFDRLAPGVTSSATLRVRNESTLPAELSLDLTHLTSEENTCVRPERREASERCGDDGGELDQWLAISVSRVDTSEQLWSGGLTELSQGPALASIPAGATWPLEVELELPWAAGNDTMTDSVSFDMVFRAAGPGSSTEVLAPVHLNRSSGGGIVAALAAGPQVGLPMTGATISLWLLLLDASLLVGGTVLLVAVRRTGRSADGVGGEPAEVTTGTTVERPLEA